LSSEHPDFGPYISTKHLVKFEKTLVSIRKDPPALGQDTAAVMARVGCSEEQIQAVLAEAKAEQDSAHNQDRIKFAASSGQAARDKS
jgi:crotonobetainyl-CoA:carnitine CoA-transferase CaiB-like acyl-CoA transferase